MSSGVGAKVGVRGQSHRHGEGWGDVRVQGPMTAPELGCCWWVPSEGHLQVQKQVLGASAEIQRQQQALPVCPSFPPLYHPAFLNTRSAPSAFGRPCPFESPSPLIDKVTVKGQRAGDLAAFLTMNENSVKPLSTNGGADYCFVCITPEWYYCPPFMEKKTGDKVVQGLSQGYTISGRVRF